MSWERKWKEFQTVDRLDEASRAYDPLNPVAADVRDDELAFNAAAQKKAEYDTGMAALQAKAKEAEAALGPSGEKPEAETEANRQELKKLGAARDAIEPKKVEPSPKETKQDRHVRLLRKKLEKKAETVKAAGGASRSIPASQLPIDPNDPMIGGMSRRGIPVPVPAMARAAPEPESAIDRADRIGPQDEHSKSVRAKLRQDAAKRDDLTRQKADEPTFGQKLGNAVKTTAKVAGAAVTSPIWAPIKGAKAVKKGIDKRKSNKAADHFKRWKQASADDRKKEAINKIKSTGERVDDPVSMSTTRMAENKWKNYQRIVEAMSSSPKPAGLGKSFAYFENLNEADQEVLDSFELQNELNSTAFEGDAMIPEIRGRLLEIAQDFLDGIDFKMDVEDITLTGSLANYNWSKYSDFDLHILVDYEAIDADPDLVKRFFQDIKAIWNIRHNIFLKGFEVEVYVQNTNENHMSSGVYSVQNDEWNLKPEREETARSPIDKLNIEKKADDISFQIDRAEKLFADGKLNDALDAVDRLKQKVRNLRKIGLSKEDGVYSVENLAFKTLRRSMDLERLSTLKNKVYDRQMSITQ